jgi:hypothetical protein
MEWSGGVKWEWWSGVGVAWCGVVEWEGECQFQSFGGVASSSYRCDYARDCEAAARAAAMAEIYEDPDPNDWEEWEQKPEKEEYVKWDTQWKGWWCEMCSTKSQKKWFTGPHAEGKLHKDAKRKRLEKKQAQEAREKEAVLPPSLVSPAGVAPTPPGSSQPAPTPPPPGLRADREHPGLPPPPDGGVTQQHVARHAGLAQTGMQEILLETMQNQMERTLQEFWHKTDPFIDFGLKLEEISKSVHVITQQLEQLEDWRGQLDERFKNIERKLDQALLKTTSSESDSAWNEVT